MCTQCMYKWYNPKRSNSMLYSGKIVFIKENNCYALASFKYPLFCIVSATLFFKDKPMFSVEISFVYNTSKIAIGLYTCRTKEKVSG